MHRLLATAILVVALLAARAAAAEPGYSFDATPGKLPKTVVPIHYAIELEPKFRELEERATQVEQKYGEPLRDARTRRSATDKKYQDALALAARAATDADKEAAQRAFNEAAGEFEDALEEETDLRMRRDEELEVISKARERYWQRVRVAPETLRQHAAHVADRSHLDLQAALQPATRREGLHFMLEVGAPIGLLVATLVALFARYQALGELARDLSG